MTPITLPVDEIIVEDRQRLEVGDISSLALSLTRFGLIQPIVVTLNHRLLAGGRRLAAAKSLGWKHIPVYIKETMSDAESFEVELEENVQRLDMDWREKCLNIAKIHETRLKQGVTSGDGWSQRKTAELLGVASVSNINDAIGMARQLRTEIGLDNKPLPTAKFWLCESMGDALKLVLRDREDELLAANALEVQQSTNTNEQEQQSATLIQEVGRLSESPDLLAAERSKYESNLLNIIPFQQYWDEKTRLANEANNTLYISNKLILGDSIQFMLANLGRFDHIITDIPYGIDIFHLEQQKGIDNIDTIKEAHDVQYNLKLIYDFFPAAFACTKPNAFVITWADQMLWQYMYDCAISAGFAVQRWPITWVKRSGGMNQMPQYNSTKDTEIAIICRKPGATLVFQPYTSVIAASRDDLSESIRHPFAKPFACWERLINMVSIEGQTILEPFAGGGSGVISMLQLKRNVIGVELEPTHYNELLENVKQYYLTINPQFVFK